jgi:hypothetical protein
MRTTSSKPDRSHVHYEGQTAIFTSSFLFEISYALSVNLIAFPVLVPPPVLRCAGPTAVIVMDVGYTIFLVFAVYSVMLYSRYVF